ncbi:hypothetical protein DL768_000767 [Monosporascus sp. mg162]|nr:hypothetical protein DL768_000767 [Monosporascus sp. mg162]
MKFHRVNNEVVELHNGGGDGTSTSSNKAQAHGLFKVLQDNPPDASDPLKRALPFQPRSYRDFMLFERHYYDAAAGMTQLYRPVIANIVNLLFGLTGVDFPFFKPHALWYEQPIFYQSNHLAFYADRAPVHYPKYCEYLDVELELGAVLGKPLFNASPEEATAAIAGFCVFNDFSARNVQMAEMSCISSAVVSADEILPRINDLTGRVVINDKTVSECKTGRWQFTIGEAIAHASKGTRLYPGEFFGSGTFPGGAGVERARFQYTIKTNTDCTALLVRADCDTLAFERRATQLDLNYCIANLDGQLVPQKDGYFTTSCIEWTTDGIDIGAKCLGQDGNGWKSTVRLNDFLCNDDGWISCFGRRGEKTLD